MYTDIQTQAPLVSHNRREGKKSGRKNIQEGIMGNICGAAHPIRAGIHIRRRGIATPQAKSISARRFNFGTHLERGIRDCGKTTRTLLGASCEKNRQCAGNRDCHYRAYCACVHNTPFCKKEIPYGILNIYEKNTNHHNHSRRSRSSVVSDRFAIINSGSSGSIPKPAIVRGTRGKHPDTGKRRSLGKGIHH